MAATLTRAELVHALGCKPAQLAAWIKAGLPTVPVGRAKHFDAATVEAWLLQKGFAEKKTPAAEVAQHPPTDVGQPRAEGVRWLAALRGDRRAIRMLVGPRKLASLRDVAEYFDVSPNTVKVNWRKLGGMPGEEGDWPLAEILIWKLDRDIVPPEEVASNPVTPRATPLDRKREADARKAEADALARELENEERAKNLCFRDDVEREWSEQIAVVRHTLLRIPAELMPRLPAKIADELSQEITKEIEAALSLLSNHSTEN